MKEPLRILHLEDEANDAELVASTLLSEGLVCEIRRVDDRENFTAAVEQGGFELVLADYSLPSFDGPSALSIAKEKCPDVPFVFVSGPSVRSGPSKHSSSGQQTTFSNSASAGWVRRCDEP